MTEKRNKRKLTITIDPNLFDMLDEYCTTNNVHKTELISLLLLKFFDEINFTENREKVFYTALFPQITPKNARPSDILAIPELLKIFEYLTLKYLAKVDPSKTKIVGKINRSHLMQADDGRWFLINSKVE